MCQYSSKVLLTILLTASGAAAQTAVTNDNQGSSGTIPVYSGNASLVNSPISILGSNVGIGTTNPTAILDVNGGEGSPATSGSMTTGVIVARSSGGVAVNLGVVDTGNQQTGYGWMSAAYANSANIFQNFSLQPNGGNIGIGTTAPFSVLHVFNNGAPANSGAMNSGFIISNQAAGVALNQGVEDTNGLQYSWLQSAYVNSAGTYTYLNLQPNGGNVGIGTTKPGANAPTGVSGTTLEVNGNVLLTQGGSGKVVFPDGTSQTTAFNPANCGADYAESVNVSGDRTQYEPGDILVIDPQAPGKFLKSNEPYSSLVAGIYSTKPGFVGRLHPRNLATDATEVPMAMVGRVPTKVSAENGPIQVGDLLVSSSILGYAMKGTDRNRMLGSIVGKALGSLDSGTGVIEVLVTLQ